MWYCFRLSAVGVLGPALLLIGVLQSRCLTAAAQELLDPAVAVLRHDKRRSSVSFAPRGRENPMAYWGMSFSDLQQPERVIEQRLTPLDQCRASEVLLREVHHHTPLTDLIDVVYYSAAFHEQRSKAKRYAAAAAPYRLVPLSGPDTAVTGGFEFARFVGISCLPARFRFRTIGSRRYMELRTGDAAWSD